MKKIENKKDNKEIYQNHKLVFWKFYTDHRQDNTLRKFFHMKNWVLHEWTSLL